MVSCEDKGRLDGNNGEDNQRWREIKRKIRGMIDREHKGNIKEGALLEMREIIGNFAKREVRLYGCYL